MSAPPAPRLDADAIRALVEEVVRRLTAGGPAPADDRAASAARAATVRAIPDAVITLAHIERLPAGTREVAIGARAVITPSARDRARDAGVSLVRAAPGGHASPAGRPFIVAQADCRGDVAGRAAAVARAVPQAQRLPATGLADVVSALALHASRDAARGILLTSRPALAVVLANRSSSLRAVTARDAATLAAAATESAANLLVVDPAAFVGSVERACADFAGRPAGAVPAELAAAPAGCGCKNHPH